MCVVIKNQSAAGAFQCEHVTDRTGGIQRVGRIQCGRTIHASYNWVTPAQRTVASIQSVDAALVGAEVQRAVVSAQSGGRPDAGDFALGFEEPLEVSVGRDRVEVAVV